MSTGFLAVDSGGSGLRVVVGTVGDDGHGTLVRRLPGTPSAPVRGVGRRPAHADSAAAVCPVGGAPRVAVTGGLPRMGGPLLVPLAEEVAKRLPRPGGRRSRGIRCTASSGSRPAWRPVSCSSE
ncbi:hypothetical protein [Streptomyces sp. NPDC048392]|uniref:hypothetical protein n=1 Tax=Streptomyces sp. NPDC048392 TaxID=3365543 RepID=UPI003716C1E3